MDPVIEKCDPLLILWLAFKNSLSQRGLILANMASGSTKTLPSDNFMNDNAGMLVGAQQNRS